MAKRKLHQAADPSNLPEGFHYVGNFISEAEHEDLLAFVTTLQFNEIRMHNVIAKRRTAHFGWDYGYESWKISPTAPMPAELENLRNKTARWMGVEPNTLEEILVTEYPAGAAIGWHRDAPMFGVVAGISLASACVFKLRPTPSHEPVLTLPMEPRSAYWLCGAARKKWQHSIRPVRHLRYSITFRTLNGTRE